MGKVHAAVCFGDIQTMPVHRFKEDGPGPIGMLVLEQDAQLLEPLQLCAGDMIMQFNGQSLTKMTQQQVVNQEAGQRGTQQRSTQLQVLRAGAVIDLFID